jgi:hypothetical protein
MPHGKSASVRNRRAADAQCGSSVTLGVGKPRSSSAEERRALIFEQRLCL